MASNDSPSISAQASAGCGRAMADRGSHGLCVGGPVRADASAEARVPIDAEITASFVVQGKLARQDHASLEV